MRAEILRRAVSTRLFAALGVATALAASWPSPARALDLPQRPIRLVVPFAAGGPTDALARQLAEGLKARLGQSVIVDNRAGAGGNIGAAEVARSEPDGTTLLFGTSGPLAINLSLYKSLAYHPLESFAPVIMIGVLPNVLAVNPKVPARSVRELVSYAKERPGQLFFASSGNGASSHLAGVLFNQVAGVELKHVPYRGTGPALNDLIAGHVHMTFTDVLTAQPHVQAGTLAALGVTTLERSTALPEVQTLAEQGVPGFDVSVFFGITVAKGTPPAIVTKLNEAFAGTLSDAKLRATLEGQGILIERDARPERLRAFMVSEVEKWRSVVAASGAQLD